MILTIVYLFSFSLFFVILSLILANCMWQAEVNFLGDLVHPNLVKLIGYCIEDDQRLLVYEFMPRGSLENHLFRSKYPFTIQLTIFHLPLLLGINCKVKLCLRTLPNFSSYHLSSMFFPFFPFHYLHVTFKNLVVYDA